MFLLYLMNLDEENLYDLILKNKDKYLNSEFVFFNCVLKKDQEDYIYDLLFDFAEFSSNKKILYKLISSSDFDYELRDKAANNFYAPKDAISIYYNFLKKNRDDKDLKKSFENIETLIEKYKIPTPYKSHKDQLHFKF